MALLPAPCPICSVPGGFHDDGPHLARKMPAEIRIVREEDSDTDRCGCGEPLSGPGSARCRNPKHPSGAEQ